MPVLISNDVLAWVARQRAGGRRIVFTNGVFDLLHVGHVRYLQAARARGDVLVVGINSDHSVSQVKGAGRPVVPQQERAEVLAALDCVDAVVVFDENDPHQIVSRLQPDVLVKGADWAADRIIGRDVVEARGGLIVRIPYVEGASTSAIIEKIKQRREARGGRRE